MKTKLILPKEVFDFLTVFKKAGFEIYVVGGAVRDLILGRNTNNWDFTTNANPEEIQKIFSDSFYNNDYGTVSVPINLNSQKLIFEITPFRKESNYADFRHPQKIEWSDTIEDDLKRRDFTINSIAFDGSKIIDPHDGQADLSNKIIRTVGDPDNRFAEDALRLIRSIRIACTLGFFLEDETRKSIQKNANLIQNISWERISMEFLKILGSPHPAEGITFLKNTGLLKFILPELEKCFAIPQKSPKRHHIYDVGTHSVEALKACSSTDPITRFATLIHDIGKADTYHKDDSELITFHNHEIVSGQLATIIADRFRLSKEQKKKLVTLVRYHMFTVSEKQTDKALRRFIKNVGKENLDEALALRIGDRIGSGAKPTSWRTELFKKRLIEVQKTPFAITDLKINGLDVMKILNLKPGPKIGEVLLEIFNLVVENKIKNDRKLLINHLSRFTINSSSGVATKGEE
ncbi:hypothetical protein A3H78_03915 [Candidatus Roizmanbacteria bacterium RIFCSPLOWO2_02_FULL_36_11]|uniref:HD domain-containing protein n=1 Tax=Candidatus Roizmanbacteria bacterium RIFCSPLOWO2_02_FULL_36_11 TaxID=1802071 RepID=A0A1F7JHM6_9BACT|nr:MAG: hypothetical protein A3H78_03915 [Candidatus Roizmanbacteria bacterium RIFCSPLOWO2_02_FULL_36_11]